SCGKCTPCREGTAIIYQILTKIALGKGENNDLETLKLLGEIMKDASFCGLGQTAPNSLLNTLQLFPEEYREHIQKKGCPLNVCRE
ncbi:MAG: NADH-quinone oxidoreductase subunit F, partial [Candidatus Infernicultor aquiphilus]